MPTKLRLDKWLADHNLAPSRQRAQALILAGCVYVNQQKAQSPAQSIHPDDDVELREKDHPFVSRGGMKLAHALDSFEVAVSEKVAVDIGASTGGFTDCLLQRGARHVYAVDVGYGQLDWKLRQDPRVTLIERCNARYWTGAEVKEPIGILTIDVSFISVKKILPSLLEHLKNQFEAILTVIILIKPQFEAERSEVGSGGVVRDERIHKRIIEEIKEFIVSLGGTIQGVTPSPIKGPKGNQEYLLVAKSIPSSH